MMKEDGRAEDASDRDKKEDAETGPSIYADQHSQPDVDIQESRAMKEDERAGDANDGDEKGNAGA